MASLNATFAGQGLSPATASRNEDAESPRLEFSPENMVRAIHRIELAELPEELRRMFARYDFDGSGTVDPNELPIPKNVENDNISLKAFAPAVREILEVFDKDGDGTVNTHELVTAAELYRGSKEKVAKLRRWLIRVILLMLMVLGVFAALTWTIVEFSKETKVGSDNVLVARGDSSGGLRGSSAINASSTFRIPSGIEAVKVSEHVREAQLSSCMPSSFFQELKYFRVKSGLVEMSLNVLGFVRINREKSKYGTVVQLITHIGRVVIDGESLFYIDDISHVFEEAGFQIERKFRQLLGLTDLIGFFNSIPMDAWDCYDKDVDGPPPRFPDEFSADITEFQACIMEIGSEFKNLCKTTSNATLYKFEDHGDMQYAKRIGRKVFAPAKGVVIERFLLPSRTEKYRHVHRRDDSYEYSWMETLSPFFSVQQSVNKSVEFRNVLRSLATARGHGVGESGLPPMPVPSMGDEDQDISTDTIFQTHNTSFAESRGNMVPFSQEFPSELMSEINAHDVGFFCEVKPVRGGKSMKELYSSEGLKAAAFLGTIFHPELGNVRHWSVRTTFFLAYLYDQRSTTDGTYLPKRLDLYDYGQNILEYRFDFSNYTLGLSADEEATAKARGLSALPDICFGYGAGLEDLREQSLDEAIMKTNKTAPSKVVSMGYPNGGIVDDSEVLMTAMPFNGIDDVRLKLHMDDIQNRGINRQAAEAKKKRRRSLLHDRKLLRYSCCKSTDSDGNTISDGEGYLPPTFEISFPYPPFYGNIEVETEFGFVKKSDYTQNSEARGSGLCYIEVAATGAIGVGAKSSGFTVGIEASNGGSISADWDPFNPGNCVEAMGCLEKSIDIKIGWKKHGVDLPLGSLELCIGAGITFDPATKIPSKRRLYLFASASATVGGMVLGTGLEAGATFFAKFWAPGPSRANWHFEPYAQIDARACLIGACVNLPSEAFPILPEDSTYGANWVAIGGRDSSNSDTIPPSNSYLPAVIEASRSIERAQKLFQSDDIVHDIPHEDPGVALVRPYGNNWEVSGFYDSVTNHHSRCDHEIGQLTVDLGSIKKIKTIIFETSALDDPRTANHDESTSNSYTMAHAYLVQTKRAVNSEWSLTYYFLRKNNMKHKVQIDLSKNHVYGAKGLQWLPEGQFVRIQFVGGSKYDGDWGCRLYSKINIDAVDQPPPVETPLLNTGGGTSNIGSSPFINGRKLLQDEITSGSERELLFWPGSALNPLFGLNAEYPGYDGSYGGGGSGSGSGSGSGGSGSGSGSGSGGQISSPSPSPVPSPRFPEVTEESPYKGHFGCCPGPEEYRGKRFGMPGLRARSGLTHVFKASFMCDDNDNLVPVNGNAQITMPLECYAEVPRALMESQITESLMLCEEGKVQCTPGQGPPVFDDFTRGVLTIKDGQVPECCTPGFGNRLYKYNEEYYICWWDGTWSTLNTANDCMHAPRRTCYGAMSMSSTCRQKVLGSKEYPTQEYCATSWQC